MDQEHTICARQILLEPGQIFPELIGQRNAVLHRTSMQSLQHPIGERAGWGATLGYKEKFAEKRPEIMDASSGFVGPSSHKIHDLPEFVGGQSDCHG